MGRALPVMALMVGLMGCGWKGPKPLKAWKAVGKSENIVAMDKAAHMLVAVQTKGVGRTADGRLELRLELANLGDQDFPVQVQTLFRDASGVPTGDDTPFEVVVLPGGGSTVYETSSLTAAAKTFTVQVRTP